MHDRQDRRDLKAIPRREHERRQRALDCRAPLLLLRDDNGRVALAGCERRRARLIVSKLLRSGLHQLAPLQVVAPLVLHSRNDAANSYRSSRYSNAVWSRGACSRLASIDRNYETVMRTDMAARRGGFAVAPG